jgi:hypothetical protein
MKQITVGVFADRPTAEEAINRAHKELHIPDDEISYVYKNLQGEIKEVDSDDVTTDTPKEGAGKGAMIGGVLGAIAGIVGIAGALPIVGPLVAGGAIASALGLTGAVGATAAGAVVGAATGGIIGALVNLGVGKEQHSTTKTGLKRVTFLSSLTPTRMLRHSLWKWVLLRPNRMR